MRLDKYLSNQGLGTRKEVKKYIENGNVSLNGEVIFNYKKKVDLDRDQIHLENMDSISKDYLYIMMNKPKGYISARKGYKKKTVIDLLDDKLKEMDLSPAGRLDIDTEGFVFLTNDGKLLQDIISPESKVTKKYYARVDKELEEADIKKFQEGIYIMEENYRCLPADLEIISPFECYVYLHEGRYHQVKRMLAACGKNVTYLKRLAIGPIKLDENLKSGDYRLLSEIELKRLKKKIKN